MAPNVSITKCRNGHPRTEQTTYVRRNGSIRCRTCNNDIARANRLSKTDIHHPKRCGWEGCGIYFRPKSTWHRFHTRYCGDQQQKIHRREDRDRIRRVHRAWERKNRDRIRLAKQKFHTKFEAQYGMTYYKYQLMKAG